MPLSTETYTFSDELERLQAEQADVEAELQEYVDAWENDDVAVETTDKYKRLRTRLSQFETDIRGVQWAIEHFDCEAVTFAELSSGEFAAVQKRVADDASEQQLRNVYVGVATVDGPYVTEGDYDASIEAVADTVHPYYVKWAENRINDLLWSPDWGN